jgi:signal transduction histidine kinase
VKPIRKRRPSRPPAEVVRLRALLAEERATLRAIRDGEVDTLVVHGKLGPRVYALADAEFNYRALIESMNEGALVLTSSALILYANVHFARMAERPLAQLIGQFLHDLLSPSDGTKVRRLLKRPGKTGGVTEVLLQRPSGAPMPAMLSIRRLGGPANGGASLGVVVSDLSELRQREDLLRAFSHGLMQRQESERMRVATDLSDNITQLLCFALMRCRSLADKLPAHDTGFREEAQEFAKMLRTTASAVHRISADLRPHGLEVLGLVPAVRGVVAEFTERLGVPIRVRCPRMSARLPAGTELVLYRVLQEALRNVEQHAHARHVSVRLSCRPATVQLAIRDDGIGFDALVPKGTEVLGAPFGLVSMRERAAAVGGALRVTSGAGTGTEVRLDVPLSPEPPPVLRPAARP